MCEEFFSIKCVQDVKKLVDEQKLVDMATYGVFTGLKITENTSMMKNHYGKHPVIRISFLFGYENLKNARNSLSYEINNLYKENKYFLLEEYKNAFPYLPKLGKSDWDYLISEKESIDYYASNRDLNPSEINTAI